MTTNERPATLVGFLAQSRASLGYALIAIGVLFIGLTLYLSFLEARGHVADAAPAEEKKQDTATPEPQKVTKPVSAGGYVPASVWAALMAALAIIAGISLIARVPPDGKEVYETRIALVVIGGVAGLMLALLGFVYAWRWQQSIVLWVTKGDLHEARWVLAALAIVLAGSALMFIGMQPARAEERNSVVLRRLLYGTNAVLSGLLLLLTLTAVNVIAFLELPENVISTAAGFKGLSKTSKEFLRTINEPVKLYLIMPEDFRSDQLDDYMSMYADCKSMLQAVESENANIKTVFLSPATDDAAIREVMGRLKIPEARREHFAGLLIGFGENEESSEFIPAQALITVVSAGSDPNRPSYAVAFQGESKLMTELNFLSGGAKRPVAYFTQSNGEPLIGEAPKDSAARTAHRLVQQLKDRKFEVKPLYFEPGKKPDVADATMIVVGAPDRPFSEEQVSFLREYVEPNKKGAPLGKLVAMLPAFRDPQGFVSPTGLEAFLVDIGIRLRVEGPPDKPDPNGQRVFMLPDPAFNKVFPPDLVPGQFATDFYRIGHPLTRYLPQNDYILFSNVRPVRLERLDVSKKFAFGKLLFATLGRLETYIDNKFDSNPYEIQTGIDNGRILRKDKFGSRNPVPIGAYVAQVAGEGANATERVRVVVIGSDCFINDAAIRQSRSPEQVLAVIGDIFEFVRERPQGMGIQASAIGTFEMPKQADALSLLYVPFGLVVLGVAALGVGVWFARRT